MARVSIITPWRNCPELIPTYAQSTAGAQLVIVDNASDADTSRLLHEMVVKSGTPGAYVYNETNVPFAAANNQGAKLAVWDVIVFLNNDIEAPAGWLDGLEDEVNDGALYGPKRNTRQIAGRVLPYLEGYCIAATRATWHKLGWWDSNAYQGPYWEDNDLCWRAQQMGIKLVETSWPVWHYGNYTSKRTPGAYADSGRNYETFVKRVQHAPA